MSQRKGVPSRASSEAPSLPKRPASRLFAAQLRGPQDQGQGSTSDSHPSDHDFGEVGVLSEADRDHLGAPEAIQRKFGFEFQSSHNSFVKNEAEEIVGEKQLAFTNPGKKFKVEGDEGRDAAHFDVEFITDPLDTMADAKTAIEGAAGLAADLGAGGAGQIARDSGAAFDGGTWAKDAAIEVGDPEFKAKPQASFGVMLSDLPKLFAKNLGREEAETVKSQASRALTDVTWRPSKALTGFIQLVMFYIKRAGRKNAVDRGDEEAFPKLGYQIIPTDGPKVNFSVMARTDFHSMYMSLNEGDRGQFVKALVEPKDRPQLEGVIKAKLDEQLILHPYRADAFSPADARLFNIKPFLDTAGREHDIVLGGPTIHDWLKSIVTGKSYKDGAELERNTGRDMLSAPVGWGSRRPETTGTFPTGKEIIDEEIYGMGAYPMDVSGPDPLAVFELRNFASTLDRLVGDGYPPATKWWRHVRSVVDRVAATEVPSGGPPKYVPPQRRK